MSDGDHSLRPYIKLSSLFVRDVDRSVTRDQLRAVLERFCPLSKGTVVIPINQSTGKILGTAYLNFWTQEDAQECLRKNQFNVVVNRQHAKMMYAAEDKDRVYGPFSFKFQIIIKNLSEEVEVEDLRDKFEEYGEIYQCKVGYDDWGQYFGQVQYLDEFSVLVACQEANGLGWHNARIEVTMHHKAHLAEEAARSLPPLPVSSQQDFPSLRGPGPAPRPSSSSSSGAQLLNPIPANSSGTATSSSRPGAAPSAAAAAAARQHQPQQHQQQQQAAPVNFAVQALEGTSSGRIPIPQPHPISTAVAPPPAAAVAAPAAAVAAVAPLAVPPAAAPQALAAAASSSQSFFSYTPSSMGLSATALPHHHPTSSPSAVAPQAVAPAGYLFDLLTGSSRTTDYTQQQQQLKQRYPPTTTSSPSGPAIGAMSPYSGGSSGEAAVANGTAAVGAATGTVGRAAAAGGVGKAGGPAVSIKKGLEALMLKLDNIAEHLTCSLTLERFIDPVVAADGFTYERTAITSWLQQNNTSPMTQQLLPNRVLLPNNLIKALIDDLLA